MNFIFIKEFLFAYRLFSQAQYVKIGKERECAESEAFSLKEKLEILQAQLAKTIRERDAAYGDYDSMKEKFEKATSQAQRLMVILYSYNLFICYSILYFFVA